MSDQEDAGLKAGATGWQRLLVMTLVTCIPTCLAQVYHSPTQPGQEDALACPSTYCPHVNGVSPDRNTCSQPSWQAAPPEVRGCFPSSSPATRCVPTSCHALGPCTTLHALMLSLSHVPHSPGLPDSLSFRSLQSVQQL